MIREATLNDVKTISSIIVKAWKTEYKGVIDSNYLLELNENKHVSNLTQGINYNLLKAFVYEENSKLVGVITGKLRKAEYDSEIMDFYVDPDSQNKGIGTKLFDEMILYFKKNERKKLIIWTLNNSKYKNFYKKKGGIEKEYKELNYGNKKYSGNGFVFNLEDICSGGALS